MRSHRRQQGFYNLLQSARISPHEPMKIVCYTLPLRVLVLIATLLPGLVAANYDLAVEAYLDGNYKRALREFNSSAEEGNAKALFHLAGMYADGKGVSRDLKKAVKLYKHSARLGVANAQYNLGVMYYTGEGLRSSEEKAVKWWEKAAEQRLPSAQFNLAVVYAKGEGVKRDLVKSYMWAYIAFSLGNQQSRLFMSEMVLGMSLKQLNEAERLANRWIDNHS